MKKVDSPKARTFFEKGWVFSEAEPATIRNVATGSAKRSIGAAVFASTSRRMRVAQVATTRRRPGLLLKRAGVFSEAEQATIRNVATGQREAQYRSD